MFAPARDTLRANPALAMDVLHHAHYGFQHRLLLWSHWGAPLLWLLAAIAYVRRQKAIISPRKLRWSKFRHSPRSVKLNAFPSPWSASCRRSMSFPKSTSTS